jgi:endonuclease/exonuclease/phosphatase family metal-dependent hydrolase
MKSFIAVFVCILSMASFAKTISLMNYNAENLFDTVHDEGKEDYTYLPLSVKEASQEIQDYCNSLTVESWKKDCLYTDYSEEVLKAKIKNLSKVIRTYNKGKGADIVVLQEVENLNVLNILVNNGLSDLGYKYIALVEGPDSRGIDVGVLSKYPVASQKLHEIDLSHMGLSTRGILEVNLNIKNKTVTVFGNHWPSQYNPSEARLAASEKLKELANASQSNIVIATGDFNTTVNDVPNGINNLSDTFIDVERQARMRVFKNLWSGTHWYKGEWASLDRIFVKRNFHNVKLKFRSFHILAYKFLLGSKNWTNYDTGEVTVYQNVPNRFSIDHKSGFSDHLPIAFKFNL